jgi:hypothetical protein
MRLLLAVLLAAGGVAASQPSADSSDGPHAYTVFVRSRPIGQETVSVIRQTDGWVIRGSNRLAAPLDVVTRSAEIQYDLQWRPSRLAIDGYARGQDVMLKTAFAAGQATSEIVVAGSPSTKTDPVSADAVVLPNAFLGSYAALARRLVGKATGATFRGYIAPQGEIAMRLDAVVAERIETPRAAMAVTRYALIVSNPPPAGDLQMSVWTDANGALLRMSVPAQMLEIARDDIASAATRTVAFSVPGDESVRIQASGFGLGASVAKPASTATRLPALILVGGSGPIDRDGVVAGIPVLGYLAADLVEAGYLVVRYDKRGVGQSGGRTEATTIADYAEDVRAIVAWLEKRKDVDRKRIGVVGHSEGAWVGLTAAARDKRIAALAMVAGVSTRGDELILEQQRHLLGRLKTPDVDAQAKVDLQKKINAAVLKGAGWEGVPDEVRRAADSPWFQSFLAYDPSRVMRDVRQPLLIVQGELDTQVAPHHADQLAALARARKRKVTVDVARVPGINHLLVPAKTGEVDEYTMLTGQRVSPAATSAIATWMARILG